MFKKKLSTHHKSNLFKLLPDDVIIKIIQFNFETSYKINNICINFFVVDKQTHFSIKRYIQVPLTQFKENYHIISSAATADMFSQFKIFNLKNYLSKSNHINLSYQYISQIPRSFFNFKRLISIDFSNNFIRILPTSIDNLIHLSYLDLSCNKLVGIPNSFCQLTRLKTLHLGNNSIQYLPNQFGNLSLLKTLSLQNNVISYLPESFCNLHRLEKLELMQNKLEKLPDSFSRLLNLKQLYLRNNNFKARPNCLIPLILNGNLVFL
ncbi:hypothetical protein DID75_04650 [Candidatus Marinamargulisbacteria bacterium SCGC AG-410-N11]|nr:hypothetical protein DID75_04650 [Candidatus Marinamargulisbacteria bacterium SCGC AG-410-N11]